MVDLVHKIVMFFATPLTVGLGLLAVGLVVAIIRVRQGKNVGRLVWWLIALSFLWGWARSTPLLSRILGMPLESEFPPVAVESYPEVDAIVLLGGGMGANTNVCLYAEMGLSADRVWHAARLYAAGKAKRITVSGGLVRESTVPLLSDFGISQDALSFFEEAKNTEDEARMIATWFKEIEVRSPRVLLVTSAWHMRRARWLFEREGVEVIPAAADYEVSVRYGDRPIRFVEFLPDAGSLYQNSYLFKEHFAYWCYRVLK